MAKKKKGIYYIIAAIIIVVILVAVFMRKPAEEKVTAPEAAAPEAAAPKAEEAAPPKPTVPTKYIGNIISEAVCVDDKIQATITNTGTESATIGDKLTVQVNGLVVRNPDCEKTTVAAGKSVFCSDLTGPFSARAGKENIVIVKLKGESAQATVTCK